MRQTENLEDNVFNQLTAKSIDHRNNNKTYWLCICSCGNEKVVRADKLKSGWTKSCGCLKEEQDKHNLGKIKHGGARRGKFTPEYNVWSKMLDRCRNKNIKRYKDYGGRGIKICERWYEFKYFLEDMGQRPSSKHTIERKDNDGDYCPENCIWATRHTQSRNKRNNIHLTIDGETKILKDWATFYGLPYKQLHAEYRKSGSLEEFLPKLKIKGGENAKGL